MTPGTYRSFDPLFAPAMAAKMVELCERFGTYRTYAEERAEIEIGEGLAQRHDAVSNFLKTGGRFGRKDAIGSLAARTNYFRESYAYGEQIMIDGIEPFLRYEGFVEGARAIHGRSVIEPAIVYANILVAGQELAVHTDVPEFRGANRKKFPQWLMVVMHHSGLFDEWRMPIATAVSWFNECTGGAFAFYPDGADGPAQTLAAKPNTAVILDTDSVFHGVDPVGTSGPLAPLRPGMRLTFDGNDRWSVRAGDEVVGTYRWNEIRFSISWKAYCFADEAERRAWREHSDDLQLDAIVDRLVADLRRRGRITNGRPQATQLALMMIEEYVRFPVSQ